MRTSLKRCNGLVPIINGSIANLTIRPTFVPSELATTQTIPPGLRATSVVRLDWLIANNCSIEEGDSGNAIVCQPSSDAVCTTSVDTFALVEKSPFVVPNNPNPFETIKSVNPSTFKSDACAITVF